jgi:hypothetical protein
LMVPILSQPGPICANLVRGAPPLRVRAPQNDTRAREANCT